MYNLFNIKNDLTLRYVIITNLILIIVITLIFSGWQVYSMNSWLEELKNYIQINIKEVKEYQKQNTKLLKHDENIIIKNQDLFKDISKEIIRDQNLTIENNKLQLLILKELQDFKNKNLDSQSNLMKRFDSLEHMIK